MKLKYLVCFVLLISFVVSQDFPNYQDKYVNDFAGVLSSPQQDYLRNLFYSVEQNSTAQVVFVSVDECAPLTPNEYATQLGQKWGVGAKDVDNGLVLLYCLAEKKFYVATGYGVEGILPDSKLGRLLDENYVPLRDAGNFSEGIVSFSRVVSDEIILNSDEVRSGEYGSFSTVGIVILWVAFFLFFFWMLYFRTKRKRDIFRSFPFYGIILGAIFIIVGAFFLPSDLGAYLIFIGFWLWFVSDMSVSDFGSKGRRGRIHWGFGGGGGFSGGGGFGGGGFGGGGAGR